jgi:hypothetical protein
MLHVYKLSALANVSERTSGRVCWTSNGQSLKADKAARQLTRQLTRQQGS